MDRVTQDKLKVETMRFAMVTYRHLQDVGVTTFESDMHAQSLFESSRWHEVVITKYNLEHGFAFQALCMAMAAAVRKKLGREGNYLFTYSTPDHRHEDDIVVVNYKGFCVIGTYVIQQQQACFGFQVLFTIVNTGG